MTSSYTLRRRLDRARNDDRGVNVAQSDVRELLDLREAVERLRAEIARLRVALARLRVALARAQERADR